MNRKLTNIKKNINKALSQLYENDYKLFEVKAHEQTLSFRLGYYLQDIYQNYNVDCEYNKDGNNPKREYMDNTQTNQEEFKEIRPDLIIHHRDTNDNYIYIEVKKENGSELEEARNKIIGVTKISGELKYKYGILIILGKNEVTIEYYENGEKIDEENKLILSFYIEAHNNNMEYNENEVQDKVFKVKEIFDSEDTLKKIIKVLTKKYSITTKDKQYDIPFPFLIERQLWGEYFSNDITHIFQSYKEMFEISIKELEKQFKITNKQLIVKIIYGIGGTYDTDGIKITMHTNEKDIHHIPHVHIKYDNKETRVNLKTLEFMDGEFRKKKINKKIIELLSKNQDNLIKYWNEVVIKGNDKVPFKIEI